MILPVTLTVAAAIALVNLWLALRIVRLRFRDKVLTGHGESAPMEARMRAQANLVEYAPFVLILMALIELGGGSPAGLWAIGAVFVVARLAHPLGMDATRPSAARAGGALATWAVLAVLAGWSLVLAYEAHAPRPAATGVEIVPAQG